MQVVFGKLPIEVEGFPAVPGGDLVNPLRIDLDFVGEVNGRLPGGSPREPQEAQFELGEMLELESAVVEREFGPVMEDQYQRQVGIAFVQNPETLIGESGIALGQP